MVLCALSWSLKALKIIFSLMSIAPPTLAVYFSVTFGLMSCSCSLSSFSLLFTFIFFSIPSCPSCHHSLILRQPTPQPIVFLSLKTNALSTKDFQTIVPWPRLVRNLRKNNKLFKGKKELEKGELRAQVLSRTLGILLQADSLLCQMVTDCIWRNRHESALRSCLLHIWKQLCTASGKEKHCD